MFAVGTQIRDKRTGEVISVIGETVQVKWSDGITRDHPLTAAQDTFEEISTFPVGSTATGEGAAPDEASTAPPAEEDSPSLVETAPPEPIPPPA